MWTDLILKRTSNKNSSALSGAEELKKFKDLLDSGAITQEEFDKKKKELLKLRRATIYKTRDLNFNRNYDLEE